MATDIPSAHTRSLSTNSTTAKSNPPKSKDKTPVKFQPGSLRCRIGFYRDKVYNRGIMVLFGDYYSHMTSRDYFPRQELQIREYLPDVLEYAQGGYEVYVEEEYAVDFLKRVIGEDKVRQETNNFGTGEGIE